MAIDPQINYYNKDGRYDEAKAIEAAIALSLQAHQKEKERQKREETKVAVNQVAAFVLPKLTDKQRKAGVGENCYSKWFVKVSGAYHRSGDRFCGQKLQRLFTQGMLRYYIQEATGIRYTIDYEKEYNQGLKERSFAAMEAAVLIRRKFEVARETKVDAGYILMVKKMIERYCEATPILLHLGIEFQRKKIELEKLEKKGGNDFQPLLQLDKEVETLQQKIHYLFQEGIQQMKEFVKDKTLAEIRVDDFQPRLTEGIQLPAIKPQVYPVELEDVELEE